MGPKMPVSCENSDAAISSSIRDSLATYNNNGITKASNLGIAKSQLTAALKQSLLRPIEYVESPPGFGYSIQDSLKAKYTVLRPSEEEKTITSAAVTHQSVGGSTTTSQQSKNGNGTKMNGACLPSPKLTLYPREKIQIGWGNTKKWSVGSGMLNLGNTCYLNSTLQALFHVPSFANWLHSDSEHRSRCEESSGSPNGCIICAMATVLQSTQSSQCPTKPAPVYSKLKQICRHLVQGHQEDAHEFLRYLMESMEKSFLLRYKNSKEFEQYTKETTPINQILGGYLRTTVKCLSCQYESVTFQHFEDLLLDIRKVNTIDEALKHHFGRERLEDMDYTCESCKRKVSATKQFSLERAPVALCIQLKRFSGINGKISKHISIAPDLDFSQYSSKDMKHSQLKYRLVSMITHLGSTPQCGHYTAIGCCQDGSYYQFDDSSVRAMSIHGLLNTNPYIIFYELVPSAKSAFSSAATTLSSSSIPSHNENGSSSSSNSKRTETSTQFIGPLLPVTNQLNKTILSPLNGCAMKYGSAPSATAASNGFTDNRKLISTNNPMMSPKTSTLTTNGNASNEMTAKNSADKSWTNVSESVSSSTTMTTSIVHANSSSLQTTTVSPVVSTVKSRNIETTTKLSNEIVTKKSSSTAAEDNNNNSSSSRNGNDSGSEIPSTPKTTNALPSMPELKSTNSPTTALCNGDGEHSSSMTHKIATVTTTTTNSLQRNLTHSPSTSFKGTVAVYISPSAKTNGNQQRSDESSRKPSASNHRESAERENKIRSPSLSAIVRQSVNPFSKASNNSVKNGKSKTNGFGHHSPFNNNNQRNTKPTTTTPTTNGYAISQRKSLVPYACHDDSDSNNEDRKSPPIVKTKAGPFQVTKNTPNGNNNSSSSSNNNHRSTGGSETRLTWSKSSNGGRVPSLNTWNGSSSILQDEIISEQRENNKRKLEKDFDLDLDIGRMKKKRSNNGHNGDRDNPTYNAFQEHQNRNQQQRGQSHHSNNHRRRFFNNNNSNYFHNNAYRIQHTGNGKRKY